MPRQLATHIHRLRLGYPCWTTIHGDARTYEFCDEVTHDPLIHYILHCPGTRRLRRLVGYDPFEIPTAAAAADTVHANKEAAAKLAKKFINSQEVLKDLKYYPPPR